MGKVDKEIVTTYFSNVHKVIKAGYTPYSIAQRQPDGFEMEEIDILMPSDFCRSLAAQHRYKEYVREYKRIILPQDNMQRLIERIAALHGYQIAFVCWEGKDKFCHRHIVSAYMNRHKFCDTEIIEF